MHSYTLIATIQLDVRPQLKAAPFELARPKKARAHLLYNVLRLLADGRKSRPKKSPKPAITSEFARKTYLAH